MTVLLLILHQIQLIRQRRPPALAPIHFPAQLQVQVLRRETLLLFHLPLPRQLYLQRVLTQEKDLLVQRLILPQILLLLVTVLLLVLHPIQLIRQRRPPALALDPIPFPAQHQVQVLHRGTLPLLHLLLPILLYLQRTLAQEDDLLIHRLALPKNLLLLMTVHLLVLHRCLLARQKPLPALALARSLVLLQVQTLHLVLRKHPLVQRLDPL